MRPTPALTTRRYSGQVDLLGLSWLKSDRYPFLLQSAASGPGAQFDILFACPQQTLELDAQRDLTGPEAGEDGFLHSLDRWWQTEQLHHEASALPFSGGWFVYLGYELAQEVEPGLELSTTDAMPVAFATRIPVAVLFDHSDKSIHIVAEAEFAHLVDAVSADLDKVAAMPTFTPTAAPVSDVAEEPPGNYLDAIASAKQFIAEGEIFQANLSRRWHAQLKHAVHPADLYARLRETNPAPFSALIQHAAFTLISSSPERLIRRQGNVVETRPIAGTRPRNDQTDNTEATRRALLESEKDRAEHVMLIDLERNDLGRVCKGGSVHVSEFMVVESYSHVHHIVSNVRGEARDDLTPGELIRAVFPGGTITGCPKVRCMEIIQQLEGRARNAYTGSIGYLNHNGDCDFNILIRTMILRDGQIEVDAGSGIVADSDPQAELEETRAKAKGLLLALQDH